MMRATGRPKSSADEDAAQVIRGPGTAGRAKKAIVSCAVLATAGAGAIPSSTGVGASLVTAGAGVKHSTTEAGATKATAGAGATGTSTGAGAA